MTSRTATAGDPPREVAEAAERRSAARAARDWELADRLRAEIEEAGWRVVNSGTAYRLEAASPPDWEDGGAIRYGRSDSVPSRLAEPESGLATVVVLASDDASETRAAVSAVSVHAARDIDIVVVEDGVPKVFAQDSAAPLDSAPVDPDRSLEVIRTSARLGRAAAINIGIRRSTGPVVVVLDPAVTPTGDVVTPLVAMLEDPMVAVAGPFGLTSKDLRHFEEAVPPAGSPPRDVAAIEGYLMAFRRGDAAARGPLDEAFRFYRNLDIWWSLVLRDEGEGAAPRRAVFVPGLPLDRHEPRAWTATRPADRDRLSKRNFYRVLDRFRTRLDLAVPWETSRPTR